MGLRGGPDGFGGLGLGIVDWRGVGRPVVGWGVRRLRLSEGGDLRKSYPLSDEARAEYEAWRRAHP